MKVALADGSIAEVTVEEFEMLADTMGWRPMPEAPKTHADKLRDVLDEIRTVNGEPKILTEAKARYPEAFVMPEAAESEKTTSAVAVMERPEEDLPAPAKMPKQVELPPMAYVTQAQQLVVELLRHYPLGLSTKDIAEKLRWDATKASRITTYLVRNESGAMHPIIQKIPGHKRYVLTEYGRRVRYTVVGNPSTFRVFR